MSAWPARKRGSRSKLTSRSRLVAGPWILAWASAVASLRAAASRLGAQAITLASIAS